MKIAILAVLTANLDDIYLKIGGVNYDLKDIMPICSDVQVGSNVAGDATWNVWVSIPCYVQEVGSLAGVGNMRIITQNDPAYISNLQLSNQAQFLKGRNYLLRFIDGPVTPIIPSVYAVAVANDAGTGQTILCGRRYLFVPIEDLNPFGALTVSAITFDLDIDVYNRVMTDKNMRRFGEAIAIRNANVSSGQTDSRLSTSSY